MRLRDKIVLFLLVGSGLLLNGAVLAGEPSRVTFTTTDSVEIVADFYESSPSQAGAPMAILLPMYRQDRSTYAPLADHLTRAGFAVLAIDLRGHGESGGADRMALRKRANERDPKLFQAMHLDVAAGYAWMARNPRIDGSRLVLVGASVGCSVALDYAARDRSVDVIVCMTPGEKYLGLDSTKPIAACKNRAILLLATEDEREATDALAALNSDVTKDIVGKGRVHGTQMFGKIDGIEEKITRFVTGGVAQALRHEVKVLGCMGGDRYYEHLADLLRDTQCAPSALRWYSSAKEATSRGLKPDGASSEPWKR